MMKAPEEYVPQLSIERKAAITLLTIYFVIGLLFIPAFFTHMDTGTRIFQCVFAVPVSAYMLWRWVVRPVLYVLGVTVAIAARLAPLVIAGFCIGAGFWLATHVL